MVRACWHRGKYVESRYHARLAPQYACWAMCLGIFFWAYWFLVRGENGDPFSEWGGDGGGGSSDWGENWKDMWGGNNEP